MAAAHRVPERLLAAAGLALFAAAAGARALPYEAAALAASAVIGLGMPWVLVAVMTAVQREAPAEAAGRLAATAHTALFVPNALALALGAALVTTVDVRLLLPSLAVAGLAGALHTAGDRVGPSRGACPGRAGEHGKGRGLGGRRAG
ncbi:hypothetical protein [Streptomyces anthocyanicus]|uniref:hypothetical protein n=1 Tax=Streptomyces anthocyanicus TaxID=68174 RepID=UPI0036544BE7